MPKAIEDLRNILLCKARPILLTQGYAQLTIRDIARASGVACGTVYHYFASKDDLVSQIMQGDWQPTIARIGQYTASVCSPIEGLRMAVNAIREFLCVYSTAWQQYRAMYRTSAALNRQYEAMIADLDTVLHPMMLRFDPDYAPVMSDFLSRTIMALAAQSGLSFDHLLPIFERLCG